MLFIGGVLLVCVLALRICMGTDDALGAYRGLGCVVHPYLFAVNVVMAYIVMAYIVMAYVVMAYVVMACIVLACIVMAYIILAYFVGAGRDGTRPYIQLLPL